MAAQHAGWLVMATWGELEQAAPDLARTARACFDAYKHKTLATLRVDGSPRISGTELDFVDGNAYLGSMPGAVKARDLLRDSRLALHSAPVDTELTLGDAKLAGRGIEVVDVAELARFVDGHGEMPPGEFHLFRLDVTELVVTSLGTPPDHLVIESWHEGGGTRRVERR
jgi:hypothetical protein